MRRPRSILSNPLALAVALSLGSSAALAQSFKVDVGGGSLVTMRAQAAGVTFSYKTGPRSFEVNLQEPLFCFDYTSTPAPSDPAKVNLVLRQPNRSDADPTVRGVRSAVFGRGVPSTDRWLVVDTSPAVRCFGYPQAEVDAMASVTPGAGDRIFDSSMERAEGYPDLTVKVCEPLDGNGQDEAGRWLAARPGATAPADLCTANDQPLRRDGAGQVIQWNPAAPVPFALGQTVEYSLRVRARNVPAGNLQGIRIRDMVYARQGDSVALGTPSVLGCQFIQSSSSLPPLDCTVDAQGFITVSFEILGQTVQVNTILPDSWFDLRLARPVVAASTAAPVRTVVAGTFDPRLDAAGAATVSERDFADNAQLFTFS